MAVCQRETEDTVKRRKKWKSLVEPVGINGCNFKNETFNKLNERFSFIWSLDSYCFCPQNWWLLTISFHCLYSSTSLIHFAPPPRLLIDFKSSKWPTHFGLLLCIIMHLLLFFWPDWIICCHLIISFIKMHPFYFLYFLFHSDEEQTLEALDVAIRIGSTPIFLYFDE